MSNLADALATQNQRYWLDETEGRVVELARAADRRVRRERRPDLIAAAAKVWAVQSTLIEAVEALREVERVDAEQLDEESDSFGAGAA